MKKRIKNILIGLLIIYSLFSIHNFITKDFHIEYKDCGKVVGSSMEDRPIKHGTSTDLYLLIEFDRDGFKAQNVDPTTYYKYKDKIGTTLCFDQKIQNPEFNTAKSELHHILGIAFIIIYIIIGLFIFINWLEITI